MTGPTPYLQGNHEPCPACELRREAQDTAPVTRDPIPCNQCGNLGYLPLSAEEIVRRTREDACRCYWPAFDRALGDPRTPLSLAAIREDHRPSGELGDDTGCGGRS